MRNVIYSKYTSFANIIKENVIKIENIDPTLKESIECNKNGFINGTIYDNRYGGIFYSEQYLSNSKNEYKEIQGNEINFKNNRSLFKESISNKILYSNDTKKDINSDNIDLKKYICNGDNECKEITSNYFYNQNKDVTVVFVYEIKYGYKALNKTLNSLKSINYIIISKSPVPNEEAHIYNYKNIWQAFNYGIKKVKTKYIAFILPGNYILENTYNFKSEADIIQLQHIRTNGVKYWMKIKNKIGIYNLYKDIPNNMDLLCDKIFKTNIINKNKLKFINNDLYAPLIFNYYYLLKSETIEVVNNKLIYTLKKDNYSLEEKTKFSRSLISHFKDITSDNTFLLDCIKLLREKHKNFIFYDQIDYVFPYVTTNDPIWQKQFKKYKYLSDDEWASGIERFRDNGMLKYTLRGIAKHMPWIKKLHIIVAYESQIPDWINRDNVHFIFHKDFIPKKHLPTFNSSTIEMFLSELPGVSNAFIYGNDDMLCFKDHSPQFFFNGGKPIYAQYIREYNPNYPGDKLRRQAYNLVLGKNDNHRVTGTQHVPQGLKLSWIKECYEKFKKEMNESCTRFREDKNYNQYVFTFYQMIEKNIENIPQNVKSYYVTPRNYEKVMEDDFSKYDFTCFNDSNETTEEQWLNLINKIDKYLPNKCKYEK